MEVDCRFPLPMLAGPGARAGARLLVSRLVAEAVVASPPVGNVAPRSLLSRLLCSGAPSAPSSSPSALLRRVSPSLPSAASPARTSASIAIVRQLIQEQGGLANARGVAVPARASSTLLARRVAVPPPFHSGEASPHRKPSAGARCNGFEEDSADSLDEYASLSLAFARRRASQIVMDPQRHLDLRPRLLRQGD